MNIQSNQYIVSLEVDSSDRSVDLVSPDAFIGAQQLTLVPTDRHGVYSTLIDNERIPVHVSTDGISTIYVSMRGYVYETRVRSASDYKLFDTLRKSPAMQTRIVSVASPMPGLLKSIHVEEGLSVSKGTTLFTLEAMKMENAIASPINGTIRSISAIANTAVEKGAVLCLIDPI